MLCIPYDEAVATMTEILERYLIPNDAQHLANIFAENSLDGVYSHGINRFPRMIADLEDGTINREVTDAVYIHGKGGLMSLDARNGVGPLIAEKAAALAVRLAKRQGIACVSLRNNTHWLRAGRYGLQIAQAGMTGLCFTNTLPNMLAWGSKEVCIGNNPLCIAVPTPRGVVLLDSAQSQFSYGKLEVMEKQGKMLPVDGGYDKNGELTRDPAAILATHRALPAGFWKGSAVSIALDMAAAAVSIGRTTAQITGNAGMSQVFIAIDHDVFCDGDEMRDSLAESLDKLDAQEPLDPAQPVRWPGENREKIRTENMKNGLPVPEKTWEAVKKLM